MDVLLFLSFNRSSSEADWLSEAESESDWSTLDFMHPLECCILVMDSPLLASDVQRTSSFGLLVLLLRLVVLFVYDERTGSFGTGDS